MEINDFPVIPDPVNPPNHPAAYQGLPHRMAPPRLLYIVPHHKHTHPHARNMQTKTVDTFNQLLMQRFSFELL